MNNFNIHNSNIEQLNNQGNNVKIVGQTANDSSVAGEADQPEGSQLIKSTEPQTSGSVVIDATRTTTSPRYGQPVTPQLGSEAPQVTSQIRLFYSYSHKDEVLREKLEESLALLKRQGLISAWHDRMIGAGEEWKNAIDKNLEEAEVVLLLVSASFLASNYCYDIEMQRALERNERGEVRLIPVILRPVDWQGAPFGNLQVLPKGGKPIIKWRPRDDGFKDVAEGIRRVIEEIAKKTSVSPSSPTQGNSGSPKLRSGLTAPMHVTGEETSPKSRSRRKPEAQPSETTTRRVSPALTNVDQGLRGFSTGIIGNLPLPFTHERSRLIAKSDSVMFLTSLPIHVSRNMYNESITKYYQCWRGPNRTVKLDANIDDLFDCIKQTLLNIIHIGASVTYDSLLFRDGELRASALTAMLKAYDRKPKLLVLDSCNSFRVGKALEDSGIEYSIVATENLGVALADSFFCEFYDSLYESGDIDGSFRKGCARVEAHHDQDPRSVLMLTHYQRVS